MLRSIFVLGAVACLVSMSAYAGDMKVLPFTQDIRPGDTIRYTVDGSIPGRSSLLVTYANNSVFVAGTTTYKARLYRPGFSPSNVHERTVYVAGTRYYSYERGWNFLSVPLQVTDRRRTALYPGAASDAYSFGPPQGYAPAETLEYGRGYMIKLSNAWSVPISGSLRIIDTVRIMPNWNLIGTISVPVAVSSVRQVPTGILSSYFYRYGSGYVASDTLYPGFGYWVKSSSPGSLVLSSGFDHSELRLLSQGILAGVATLVLCDSNGATQSLYFTSSNLDEKQVALFELPPPPPTDVMVARYGSGRILEVGRRESTKEVPVEISNACYPLTVSWKQNDEPLVAALLTRGNETIVTGRGSTVVLEGPIFLRLGAESSVPQAFELSQNFPNPFNPSTRVRFRIPRTVHVILKLYDVVGREVGTLVDEVMTTGAYQRTLNGEGLASGIYFFQMRAAFYPHRPTAFLTFGACNDTLARVVTQ
jgi:hypothetical protein